MEACRCCAGGWGRSSCPPACRDALSTPFAEVSLNGFALIRKKLPLYGHHKVHAALLPAGAHGLNGKEKGLKADPHEVFGDAVDSEDGGDGSHDFEEGGSSRLVETTIQNGGPVSGACNKKLYKESLAPTAFNHSPTHVPVVVKRMVFPLTNLPPM